MKTKTLLVLLLSVVSVIMWGIRLVMLRWLDIGMVWNLFLAWMPLFIIKYAEMKWSEGKISKPPLMIYIGAWLLFFPNAPYLITDLIHLKSAPDRMLWYDALMRFSFALSGLLTGLYSLLKAHRLVEQLYKPHVAWLFVIFSLVLSSYGIYLGRYGRWNSWDIVAQPFSLIKYSIWHLSQPLAIQTVLAFSFALGITYIAFWLYAQLQPTYKRGVL